MCREARMHVQEMPPAAGEHGGQVHPERVLAHEFNRRGARFAFEAGRLKERLAIRHEDADRLAPACGGHIQAFARHRAGEKDFVHGEALRGV